MANTAVQMQKIASNTQLQIQKLSNANTAKTFAFNKEEAETSRKWQKEMSDTSHQREVKDLIKAGLNPVLSSGGSGAQSYTTSSASGQAENPSNAIASLQSIRMSGMANIEASSISAAATRAAAAASARAMRDAAATQAAAARYAASMNYQLGVYRADKDFQARKYTADKSYQSVIDKPVSNPWALADKYFGNSNFGAGVKKIINQGIGKFINDPADFFKQARNNVNRVHDFALNSKGVQTVNSYLKKLGLSPESKNRNLFVNAFVFGDHYAARSLAALMKKDRDNTNSAYAALNRTWRMSI